jgi:hypothetical protein
MKLRLGWISASATRTYVFRQRPLTKILRKRVAGARDKCSLPKMSFQSQSPAMIASRTHFFKLGNSLQQLGFCHILYCVFKRSRLEKRV